ncbi:MAG TPA: hypothetical protein VEP90_11190 [Methylomirabilota bacterium]|nr:hypothetical protein [Methylomirabilota bacterium]
MTKVELNETEMIAVRTSLQLVHKELEISGWRNLEYVIALKMKGVLDQLIQKLEREEQQQNPIIEIKRGA